MLTVYVKHYLTPDGIDFFKQTWFPKVLFNIRQQEGFISLTYAENRAIPDCVDIVLLFKNQETLDRWIAVPLHDALIEELDPYRSRDYWEAAGTDDETADPSKLEWENVTLNS